MPGPNHIILILIGTPDIRSARFYGQFFLDKTQILQAGATVSWKFDRGQNKKYKYFLRNVRVAARCEALALRLFDPVKH